MKTLENKLLELIISKKYLTARNSKDLYESLIEFIKNNLVKENMKSIPEKIRVMRKTDLKSDAVGEYAEFYINDILSLIKSIVPEKLKIKWVKYSDKKPLIGELVACYRDIESKNIFITEWDEEEENWAEMNNITHWFKVNYPNYKQN